jgi:hypothetical protein
MVLRKPVLRAGWLLSSHSARVATTRAGAATRLYGGERAGSDHEEELARSSRVIRGANMPRGKVPSRATKSFGTESNKTIIETSFSTE